MIRRIVERNVAILLVGMIMLDVLLFVRVWTLNRRLQSINTVLRPATRNDALPALQGFARDGTRLNLSGTRKGWAVRYADVSCKYCANDTQWKQLGAKLQDAGFEVFVLLPTATGEFPENRLIPEGIQQEAYVNIDWIKHFHLSATPTLLLFDNRRSLVWYKEGVLDPADVASALKAINGIG